MRRCESVLLTELLAVAFATGVGGCVAADRTTNSTADRTAAGTVVAASGDSSTFTGCRGQGNWVCTETVNASYFVAHPNCTANPTCAGNFYDCWDECPPPQPSELPSRWIDPHFRTFGKFSDGTSTLGFREGSPGYVPGSDIITVGMLDNNNVGPFAGLGGGSEGALAQRWMFLREASPDSVNYGFASGRSGLGDLRDQLLESMMPDVVNWEERTGRAIYHKFIETITGQSSPYYYMKDVLLAQFNAEKPLLDGWIRARITDLENRYLTSCPTGPCLPHGTADAPAIRLQSFVPTVDVEVGNEPNMYPAMSPRLYAWYYLKYRQQIQSVVSAINRDRRAAGKQDAKVLLMPAGLWMMDGFPDAVRTFIDNGVSAKAVGVTVSARVFSDAGNYMREFLRYLRQPQYVTTTGKPHSVYDPNSGRTFGNVVTYDPEDLGTLSNVTYSWYDANGAYVGTSPGRGAGTYAYFYRFPRSWTVAPTSALVDIGNLHFYPYVGPASGQDLATQLQGLRDLANSYAGQTSTGKVWLTEMGNINSGGDDYVINEIMRPTIAYLLSSIPSISRWYWYQNRGEDIKFAQLNNLPSLGVLAAGEVGWWMVGSRLASLVSLLPGFDVTVPFTEQVGLEMDAILYNWRDSNPRQGLMDAGDDGAMRQLGVSYMAAAHATGDNYSDYIAYTAYQ